jgi:hypothetical protein
VSGPFGYGLSDAKFWKDLTDLDTKAAGVAIKPGKLSEKSDLPAIQIIFNG